MALEFLELELEPVVIHLAVLGSKLQTSATTEPTLGPTAHDFLSTKPIKNKYEKIKNNLVIFIDEIKKYLKYLVFILTLFITYYF